MEFQVQSVYLIYTWLMVYTILNLAYPKGHVCYDLKLELRLYLDKDLRGVKGYIRSGKA